VRSIRVFAKKTWAIPIMNPLSWFMIHKCYTYHSSVLVHTYNYYCKILYTMQCDAVVASPDFSDVRKWFWSLVRSLSEEEKALLLKFCTGSPRVPVGGFASLEVSMLVF